MMRWHLGPTSIPLTEAEISTGFDRVRQAEALILQLPPGHEGRNSWLLQFGSGEDAKALRNAWEQRFGKPFPRSS